MGVESSSNSDADDSRPHFSSKSSTRTTATFWPRILVAFVLLRFIGFIGYFSQHNRVDGPRKQLSTMVSVWSLEALLWSLVLAAVCWVLLWSGKKQVKLPPGPKGFPFIGHIHVFAGLAHRSLQQLSQRFGPIMFLKLGTILVIVVSSPEMAKEVLKNQDTVFASRPAIAASRHVVHNKDFVFCPYGERLKRLRKLCTTELFTGSRIHSFMSIMQEELFNLCCRLLEASETSQMVDLRRYLLEYNFNNVTRILFRKRYFGPKASRGEEEEAHEFLEMVDYLVKVAVTPAFSDFYPSLAWLDWSIPRLKMIGRKTDTFLQKVIDAHEECEDDPDFLSIMQVFFGRQDVESINAMLVNLLGAGTETSITTIEWALAELLHNPSMMRRAQKEIESVVGVERMVEESDIPKLKYLDAVIKEVLRMHTPAPLLIPHASTRDTNIAGYDIPNKSTVFVNVYAICRDPEVWKDPDTFYPDRFIGSSINVNGQDFELLPFGSGRRICPGLTLGMKTVQLTLSNLLHGFEWNFPKPVMEEKFAAVTSLLHFPQGQVSPRLPPKTYQTLVGVRL